VQRRCQSAVLKFLLAGPRITGRSTGHGSIAQCTDLRVSWLAGVSCSPAPVCRSHPARPGPEVVSCPNGAIDLGLTGSPTRGREIVRTAHEFRRMSGDLADPTCIPFAPWLDYATSDAGRLLLRCWGMSAFGLVDLAVELQAVPDAPEFESEFNLAVTAMLFAQLHRSGETASSRRANGSRSQRRSPSAPMVPRRSLKSSEAVPDEGKPLNFASGDRPVAYVARLLPSLVRRTPWPALANAVVLRRSSRAIGEAAPRCDRRTRACSS
jgi:hypothetical protein